MKTLICTILLFSIVQFAYAHSGRTDSVGCHKDTNTNIEHCHNEPKKGARLELFCQYQT